MHDLDALYLLGLASDRVVVLFDDEQGIVVIERELGVVRERNIRVALDQVRVLEVDGSGDFIAVGVLQIEDQDEVLGVANAVELDDDATGSCCRVNPLSATIGGTRVDSDAIRRLGCTNPVLVEVGDRVVGGTAVVERGVTNGRSIAASMRAICSNAVGLVDRLVELPCPLRATMQRPKPSSCSLSTNSVSMPSMPAD